MTPPWGRLFLLLSQPSLVACSSSPGCDPTREIPLFCARVSVLVILAIYSTTAVSQTRGSRKIAKERLFAPLFSTTMCPTPDSPPRHVTSLNQVIPDQETKSHLTPQWTQMKIGDKDQTQLQVDTGGEQAWVCKGSHPMAGEFMLSRNHPPIPSNDC